MPAVLLSLPLSKSTCDQRNTFSSVSKKLHLFYAIVSIAIGSISVSSAGTKSPDGIFKNGAMSGSVSLSLGGEERALSFKKDPLSAFELPIRAERIRQGKVSLQIAKLVAEKGSLTIDGVNIYTQAVGPDRIKLTRRGSSWTAQSREVKAEFYYFRNGSKVVLGKSTLKVKIKVKGRKLTYYVRQYEPFRVDGERIGELDVDLKFTFSR